MISAKIIADSISTAGARLTTLELEYPRFIHGELMTHRAFSRNAMSSRAVPVARMLAQVRDNPVVPVHIGANKPGMQAGEELGGADREQAVRTWRDAAAAAAYFAEELSTLGAHKQVANRLLEPFQLMRTIVSATEWDNFFALRRHPDAEPHFQMLANAIFEAREASTPVLRECVYGQGKFRDAWHLPYVSDRERADFDTPLWDLVRASAARVARVSYLNHDGTNPDMAKDIALYERLAGAAPIHASPLEPVALAMAEKAPNGNFVGWGQLRGVVEEAIATGGETARAFAEMEYEDFSNAH